MINEKRLIDTFLNIVQVDSPSGNEGEIIKFLSEGLSSKGLKPIIDTYGNLIVKVPEKNEGGAILPSILLTAHVDTVEPGRGVKPVITSEGLIKSSGDTILGADNKAAVAVLLEVIDVVLERNDISHMPLEFVFTISEEVGNYGAVNLDYSLLNSKIGFSFDSGSPVGTIITASPFYNRFDATVYGQAGHASRPENTINTLNIFNAWLNSIKLGRVDEDTTCNIGVVTAGSARNTVPGVLEIKGEVRSFVESKLVSTTDVLMEALRNSAESLGGRVGVEVVRENPGFKFDDNDEMVATCVDILEEALERKAQVIQTGGCYDANIFIGNGIKVLNFGNGSKYAHAVEEEIAVVDLVDTARLALELTLNFY